MKPLVDYNKNHDINEINQIDIYHDGSFSLGIKCPKCKIISDITLSNIFFKNECRYPELKIKDCDYRFTTDDFQNIFPEPNYILAYWNELIKCVGNSPNHKKIDASFYKDITDQSLRIMKLGVYGIKIYFKFYREFKLYTYRDIEVQQNIYQDIKYLLGLLERPELFDKIKFTIDECWEIAIDEIYNQ